eukprot:m.185494 g.185494  ORF g.185494 m.185494 type:complete len:500 (-) comp14731_c0_seq1:286-1785(-)
MTPKAETYQLPAASAPNPAAMMASADGDVPLLSHTPPTTPPLTPPLTPPMARQTDPRPIVFVNAVLEQPSTGLSQPPSVEPVVVSQQDAAAPFVVEVVVFPTEEDELKRRRRMMWFYLFLHTLFAGMTSFMFRLQVVLGTEPVASGLFIALMMMGAAVGYVPVVIYAVRTDATSQTTPFHSSAILGFFAGITMMLGYVGYMLLTNSDGEASVLAPLAALCVIIPILYGVFFLKDKLSVRRFLGICVGVSASLMFAFSGGNSSDFNLKDPTNIGYLAMCLLSWGATVVLFQLIAYSPPHQRVVGLIFSVIGFFACGVACVFGVFELDMPDSLSVPHWLVFAGGVSYTAGNFFFVLFSAQLPSEAAVVAPLESLYVLWPIILGMAVLHEAATPLKIAGIFASLVGILMMGITDFRELGHTIFPSCIAPAPASIAPADIVLDDDGKSRRESAEEKDKELELTAVDKLLDSDSTMPLQVVQVVPNTPDETTRGVASHRDIDPW